MSKITTLAIGEEDKDPKGPKPTTEMYGEEEPTYTTQAIGEEEPVFTTLALGEEDGGTTGSPETFGAF